MAINRPAIATADRSGSLSGVTRLAPFFRFGPSPASWLSDEHALIIFLF